MFTGACMTVRALIFDFDGLLVDTETLHYQTWNSLYESYGVKLRLERWLLDLGTRGMFDPVAELEELLGRPIERDATLSDRRAHHIGLVEQEELRPGVREILAAGREAGLKVADAPGSSCAWVGGWLWLHGIR